MNRHNRQVRHVRFGKIRPISIGMAGNEHVETQPRMAVSIPEEDKTHHNPRRRWLYSTNEDRHLPVVSDARLRGFILGSSQRGGVGIMLI